MYEPPFSIKEIKEHYPDKADFLLKDPVHLWRAESGIELIHKEPTLEEQLRIWKNWNEMPDNMKKISDAKSLEFFGIDNLSHHQKIIGNKI